MQKILGHHSVITTSRYTHLTTARKASAETCINELMQRYTVGWKVAP